MYCLRFRVRISVSRDQTNKQTGCNKVFPPLLTNNRPNIVDYQGLNNRLRRGWVLQDTQRTSKLPNRDLDDLLPW